MPPLITEHLAVVETDVFKSENVSRFYAYLLKKRGERERPQLSDIDLMDLYDIAPSICIRDVVDDGRDFRCRYWGSRFVEAYQVECTDKLISETYSREGVANTLELHRRALSSPLPLRVIGNLGYTDESRDHVEFEGLMTCVDGKDFPKQHIFAVGQFDYAFDNDDRALLARAQKPAS